MSSAPVVFHPPVSWAQRNDLLYVTIEVECKDIDYKVTEDSLKFTAKDALDSNKSYDLQLNFLKSVDPERVTVKNIARLLEFTIYKKESGPYWPSLTNDKIKLHFLKANFNKWKEESDGEDEDNLMQGDWPKCMQPDELKNFDDFDYDDDSDDNIPSLSQNDEDDEADEKGKEDKVEKPSAEEKK